MNVSRPHRVSVQQLQHLPGRAVVRNWIRRRPQAVQAVPTLFVRREPAPQVAVLLIRVLLLVQPVGTILPHVDHHTRDALAGHGVDAPAMHVGHLPVGGHGLDDGGAIRIVRRVLAEEWAEDRRRGVGVLSVRRSRECDLVYEAFC